MDEDAPEREAERKLEGKRRAVMEKLGADA
jgi:hypothetical protein